MTNTVAPISVLSLSCRGRGKEHDPDAHPEHEDARHPEPHIRAVVVIHEEPKTDTQRSIVEFLRSVLSSMIAKGLLDEQTLKLAIDEVRAWYKDPAAFRFFPEFFVAGRVV